MMQRTITVVSAATGASADVSLDTSGERMLGDVVDALATLTGGPATPVTRDGIRLDERMPLTHLHDGDVVVLAADPTSAPGSQSSPDTVVEVVAGPDAGRRLLLGAGRHVLGRDATALHSSDSAISRAHLQVVVDRDAVSVSDLDSVNGTWVRDR